MEWYLLGQEKAKYAKTNLTQCHFTHQKSQVVCHWFEYGPAQQKEECKQLEP